MLAFSWPFRLSLGEIYVAKSNELLAIFISPGQVVTLSFWWVLAEIFTYLWFTFGYSVYLTCYSCFCIFKLKSMYFILFLRFLTWVKMVLGWVVLLQYLCQPLYRLPVTLLGKLLSASPQVVIFVKLFLGEMLCLLLWVWNIYFDEVTRNEH